jgi:hypothetical protein
VRILRFGSIAWLALLPLHAAEIVVAGRAIDENEAGVAGVDVTVRNQSGEQWHAATDPTGGFKIGVPAEGQYFFAATEAGYLPVKNLAVDVRASMGEVYLILNHAKEVLQSVDVNASPQAVDVEQTQSERVLSGIQIMDIPYPSTHSLREAMALIPGPNLCGTNRRSPYQAALENGNKDVANEIQIHRGAEGCKSGNPCRRGKRW